jgi:XTP/dITP diphosphohydrolase
MSLELLFVTSNPHKISEADAILRPHDVIVKGINLKVEELQTDDTERLAKDKVLKAFREVGRPLFVEHTGLHLTHLNGLPGGLTQLFWDKLEADQFAQLFGNTLDTSVVAKTIICHIDGRKCRTFAGEAAGHIAPEPRGSREFQWDCCFIPDGYDQTYAELGQDRKNAISMRKAALDNFASFIRAASTSGTSNG